VWWLAAFGLLAWRKALYFTPKERERPPRTRVFGFAWGFLPLAPTCFALSLGAAGDFKRTVFEGIPDMGATKGFLAVAAAGAIPQFVFTLLFTLLAVRQNKTFFPDLSRRDMAMTALQHAPAQVLIATGTQIFLAVASGAGADYGFIAALGLGFSSAWLAAQLRGSLWRSRPGTPFPMDDCPLKDEITSVARAAGFAVQNVYVAPAKLKKEGSLPSDYENALRSFGSLQRLDPLKPLLPLVMIQRMDPATVTASLAVRFVRSLKWKIGTATVVTTPMRRIREALLMGIWLFAVVALSVGIGERSVSWALVGAALVLASGVLWLRRRMALARKGLAWKYREACRLWCQAAPAEDRTTGDFIRSLVRFSEWALHHSPPEQILAVYETDPSWLEFLDEAFPGGRKEGRAILRQALTERS